MADFDSADLLARLRRLLKVEDDTADAGDTDLYELLANGQRRMAQLIAAVNPEINMLAIEQLSTSDSGETYTLTHTPLANLELYDGDPNGVPIYPVGYHSIFWDGYILEGTTIRWPGGRTRTFGRGLWARYNRVPAAISASTEPSLKPTDARQGIVYCAAEEFCEQGGAMDPTPYTSRLGKFLYGDRLIPGDTGLIGRLQTQSRGQGLRSSRRIVTPWHRSPDLNYTVR